MTRLSWGAASAVCAGLLAADVAEPGAPFFTWLLGVQRGTALHSASYLLLTAVGAYCAYRATAHDDHADHAHHDHRSDDPRGDA